MMVSLPTPDGPEMITRTGPGAPTASGATDGWPASAASTSTSAPGAPAAAIDLSGVDAIRGLSAPVVTTPSLPAAWSRFVHVGRHRRPSAALPARPRDR